MEKFSFFDAQKVNGNYDRTYRASDLAEYFGSFISNGVFANPATSLQVKAGKDMSVVVSPGKAFINGYYYANEDDKIVNIGVGEGEAARFDLVVLSLNLSKRLIEVKVLKGASETNPNYPTLTRNKDIYEIALAAVRINSGAIKLTDADITDLRFFDKYCGKVASTVDTITTDKLFRQYQAEFDNFFTSIQGKLSGDIAGKLATSITEVESRLNKLEIGGRNLVLNTGEPVGAKNINESYDNVYMNTELRLASKLENGYSYTISGHVDWFHGEKAARFGKISIRLINKDDGWRKSRTFNMPITEGKDFSYTISYDPSKDYTTFQHVVVFWGEDGRCDGNTLRISNLKLERGSVATAYTEAPEDIKLRNTPLKLKVNKNPMTYNEVLKLATRNDVVYYLLDSECEYTAAAENLDRTLIQDRKIDISYIDKDGGYWNIHHLYKGVADTSARVKLLPVGYEYIPSSFNQNVKIGTTAAPQTGTPNTIYIQMV